jgi:hypothetical protein
MTVDWVRFEVSTEVTMKNVASLDIKHHFVHHRRHITSPQQTSAGKCYVRFEVFIVVTMKNVVFWDIKLPVYTSQETHYVSATEPSRLMLWKIWGLHGGDYEECRLLGYKTPVCTSQETHYVSTTVLSLLMLCKIWGFHGSDYEECLLLGCYAVWLL